MPGIRHNLTFEKKLSLVKGKDNGKTHRKLAEKYKIALGAVTNIMKRRDELKLTNMYLERKTSKQSSIYD
jgi:Mor family transcriptional regulator